MYFFKHYEIFVTMLTSVFREKGNLYVLWNIIMLVYVLSFIMKTFLLTLAVVLKLF